MENVVPKLRFPEFEGNWEQKKLGDITTWSSGGTPPKDNFEYWNGSIPWISASSMRGLIYSTSDKKITEKGLKNGSRLAKKGSLLLLVRGSMLFNKIPIGIAGIDVAFNQDLKSITVNESSTSQYLLYWFISKEPKLLDKVTGTGIGAGKLDLTDLKDLNIVLPNLSEQTKIANFLTAIDEKINLLKEKATALAEYKKGMMQKIFNQELRFKDEFGKDFEDWEEKSLGEICEINKGNQLNKDDLTDFDIYPSISGGIEPSGYTDKSNREENTIIISEGGNSCGFVNYIKTKFWCGGHCYSIDIMENIYLNTDFLFQLLKFNQTKIMALRVGSGLPNIQKKDLKKFNLFFTSNSKEQTKIATFLSAIDEKIDLVKTQIEESQEYKKGLLQQMFV